MDNQREKSARAIAKLFTFDKKTEQTLYEIFLIPCEEVSHKSVYIFDTDSGVTKIGVASDCDKRLDTLSRIGGYKILNRFISEPVTNAFVIETAMHKHFTREAKHGEYFHCNFQAAVSHLVSLL